MHGFIEDAHTLGFHTLVEQRKQGRLLPRQADAIFDHVTEGIADVFGRGDRCDALMRIKVREDGACPLGIVHVLVSRSLLLLATSLQLLVSEFIVENLLVLVIVIILRKLLLLRRRRVHRIWGNILSHGVRRILIAIVASLLSPLAAEVDELVE